MSFLTRTTATAFRSTRLLPRALFSTSVQTQKSTVDAARDTLKEVDRKVADVAVKGIEKGGMSFPLYNRLQSDAYGSYPS